MEEPRTERLTNDDFIKLVASGAKCKDLSKIEKIIIDSNVFFHLSFNISNPSKNTIFSN